MHKVNKKMTLGLIAAALCAAAIFGCNGSNEQVSSDYQKLPPAEAKKRSDNLLKLRGGKPTSQPAAGQSNPQ